jgi:hypothetical protein
MHNPVFSVFFISAPQSMFFHYMVSSKQARQRSAEREGGDGWKLKDKRQRETVDDERRKM